MKLNLIHLFPKKMNIYGDWGNIEVLKRRITLRGIEFQYIPVDTKTDFEYVDKGDIFFFGGGQDSDQMDVWHEIESSFDDFRSRILSSVESKKVFLLICGGYQMFGKFFIDAKGRTIPGLGILDIETKSAGGQVAKRCIGNIAVETKLPISPITLVGFENHGGQTYFGTNANGLEPLGKVISGFGNNHEEGVEGCIYKNIFGSYMHGSLLPKNPHFADHLILMAQKAKYGQDYSLPKLEDNSLEMKAHKDMLERLGVK